MIEEILNNARLSSNGRRVFTAEQKSIIIKEWENSGMSGPEFGRLHGLLVQTLYLWRKSSMRGAAMGIKSDGDLYTKAELNTLKNENDELKKALAEAHLDNRILKKS